MQEQSAGECVSCRSAERSLSDAFAQEIVREVHKPTTERVLDAVRAAYTQEEPLMSYTELPTIVISGMFLLSTQVRGGGGV